MAITSDDETRQTDDVVVRVRVPSGAAGDLTTETERRLARVAGVTDVTVEKLRGIEPGLSATVVTVAVRVETAGERTPRAVCDELAETPFVEEVADTHR